MFQTLSQIQRIKDGISILYVQAVERDNPAAYRPASVLGHTVFMRTTQHPEQQARRLAKRCRGRGHETGHNSCHAKCQKFNTEHRTHWSRQKYSQSANDMKEYNAIITLSGR